MASKPATSTADISVIITQPGTSPRSLGSLLPPSSWAAGKADPPAKGAEPCRSNVVPSVQSAISSAIGASFGCFIGLPLANCLSSQILVLESQLEQCQPGEHGENNGQGQYSEDQRNHHADFLSSR